MKPRADKYCPRSRRTYVNLYLQGKITELHIQDGPFHQELYTCFA